MSPFFSFRQFSNWQLFFFIHFHLLSFSPTFYIEQSNYANNILIYPKTPFKYVINFTKKVHKNKLITRYKHISIIGEKPISIREKIMIFLKEHCSFNTLLKNIATCNLWTNFSKLAMWLYLMWIDLIWLLLTFSVYLRLGLTFLCWWPWLTYILHI